MHTESQLKRITSLTSLMIALAIAISIPLGYFMTAYKYENQLLKEQTVVSADKLSKHIYAHPNTWQFQDHRLEEIISQGISLQRRYLYYQRIHDISNQLTTTVGDLPDRPHLIAQEKLTNGIKVVGIVETYSSLRPLLYNTLIVAFLALLIALSVWFALRILPFAALERVMKVLQASQDRLTQEIAAKQSALQKQQRMSETMQYQAMHDVLTGLPNRANFQKFFEHAVTQAKIHASSLAVMILDLNRFKEINDTLGHQTGDKVLIRVGKIIREALPDYTFIARLGGDEYAVIVLNMRPIETKEQAELMTRSLRNHLIIDGYHISVSGSIGMAYYPMHGTTTETLLKHADIAMYHAKNSSHPYCVYDKSYQDNNPSQLSLTADLRQAISNFDLCLFFQPKMDFTSGEIIGVEALARWQHPQHGEISPEIFIPLAEQSGMINMLTNWVMETALKQLSAWHAVGLKLNMAINISARNLQNEDFPRQIELLLQQYKIPAHCINLEITESSMMIDPAKSIELINHLSKLGIQISVDDFGTGYSSLAYLKKLTVHELKIDRSFIRNKLQDQDDQVIVRSTIELAHNLNMIVVAEGIEDQPTYDLLKEYGCDMGQGFHICSPQSADYLDNWFNQKHTLARNAS